MFFLNKCSQNYFYYISHNATLTLLVPSMDFSFLPKVKCEKLGHYETLYIFPDIWTHQFD